MTGPAHKSYVDKVIGAVVDAGVDVPTYEVEDDEVRKAYVLLGAPDPDSGRETWLCWNEESGWYYGIDQNGTGVLNLLRWANLGVLPDAGDVARWAVEQTSTLATPDQMERPRYRDSADEDDFAAQLAQAGARVCPHNWPIDNDDEPCGKCESEYVGIGEVS